MRAPSNVRAAGAAAAAVQLSAGELVAAAAADAVSPLAAASRVAIDLTPAPLVDLAVVVGEGQAKPFLVRNVAATAIGLGALGAGAGGRRGAAAAILLNGALGVLASRSAREGQRGPRTVAGVAGGAAGLVALATLGRSPSWVRLGAAISSAGGMGLAARRIRGARRRSAARAAARIRLPRAARPLPAPPAECSFELSDLSPLFTPNERFYSTHLSVTPPDVAPDAWRLRVGGLSRHQLELGLDELVSMPLVEVDSTLVCVHNPVGGDRIGTARWLGVPVTDLMALAEPSGEADQLLAHSLDGFSSALPLTSPALDRALVVVGMNGEPLPPKHGFPARLLSPGSYGQWGNVKWLSGLELSTLAAAPDYWHRRGWPATGAVMAHSRIDVPRKHSVLAAGEVDVAGVAWAPPSGIAAVEVQVDDGAWREAELAAELAPTTWRQWRLRWQAGPGPHVLRVRARTSDVVQEDRAGPPFPAGSTGHHAVRVNVVANTASLDAAAGDRARAAAELAGQRARMAGRVVAAWRAAARA